MKRAPLSRGAYRCLKALKSYDFQKRGWSCPNHKTLGADLRVTTRQIKRYIAELQNKSYLIAKRRPNTSSLYYFGGDKIKNVPTKGTKNVPTDVPTDVPTVHIFLKQTNAQVPDAAHLQPQQPEPLEEAAGQPTEKRTMTMPAFYRGDPSAEKLWRFALRWISQNPTAHVEYVDYARIMHALEDAGALQLEDGAQLPQITWPRPKPESSQPGKTLQLLKPSVPRKPVASEELTHLMRKIQEAQP